MEPAFPAHELSNDYTHNLVTGESVRHVYAHQGMSLRDYFAAKAMQGDCSRTEWAKLDLEDLASWAYTVADALLAERDKNGG